MDLNDINNIESFYKNNKYLKLNFKRNLSKEMVFLLSKLINVDPLLRINLNEVKNIISYFLKINGINIFLKKKIIF